MNFMWTLSLGSVIDEVFFCSPRAIDMRFVLYNNLTLDQISLSKIKWKAWVIRIYINKLSK